MALKLVKGDITEISCDAIVNATGRHLTGGGGVDKMIHDAAGPGLDAACAKKGYCEVGDAFITDAFNLDAKYVIHTVGPVWYSGSPREKALLGAAYESALELAAEYGCKTVAVPLISAGTHGCPPDIALGIAKDSIESFLEDHEDITVMLVAYKQHTYALGAAMLADVKEYVSRNFTGPEESEAAAVCYSLAPEESRESIKKPHAAARPSAISEFKHNRKAAKPDEDLFSVMYSPKEEDSLDGRLKTLDESFAGMLQRKIKEKHMTNVECYTKALSTKSAFSKIKNNPDYKPTKPTVVGYVIALKLPLDEAKEMIAKAGYSFMRNNKFDVIVEWFIIRRQYDVYALNEVLMDYDQQLIGY